MKRLILAALGYALYRWWQSQPADDDRPVRNAPVRRRPARSPAPAE